VFPLKGHNKTIDAAIGRSISRLKLLCRRKVNKRANNDIYRFIRHLFNTVDDCREKNDVDFRDDNTNGFFFLFLNLERYCWVYNCKI
jgi:hypothetical protein